MYIWLCECPTSVCADWCVSECVCMCVCMWWMHHKFDPLLQGQRGLSGVLFIILYVFFWGTTSLWTYGSHTGKSGSQKALKILLPPRPIKSGVSGTCGDVWFVVWVLSSSPRVTGSSVLIGSAIISTVLGFFKNAICVIYGLGTTPQWSERTCFQALK